MEGGLLTRIERNERTLDDHEERLRPLEKESTTTSVTVKNIEKTVEEIKSDAKASKNLIRSALLTAAASIGVNLILFFVQKAGA